MQLDTARKRRNRVSPPQKEKEKPQALRITLLLEGTDYHSKEDIGILHSSLSAEELERGKDDITSKTII